VILGVLGGGIESEGSVFIHCPKVVRQQSIVVLDLASWVGIAVLMNVYLRLGNSGGSGFWNEGYMSQGREMDGLVYEQPEDKVDGSCHSKEGSK
jgi:hypothetical protein